MIKNMTKTAANYWASTITHTWEDEGFKQKLLADPKEVLMELDYSELCDQDGDEITVKVEEASSGESCAYNEQSKTLTFYLPQRPECLGQMAFESKFMEGISS